MANVPVSPTASYTVAADDVGRRTNAMYCKIFREKRKSLGGCVRCKNKAVPGKLRCRKHILSERAKSRESKAKRKDCRLCATCGGRKEKTTGESCDRCLKKSRETYRRIRSKRKNNGTCLTCGKIKVYGKINCKKCTAILLGHNKSRRRRIRDMVIERYGGRCACDGCPEHLNPHMEFLVLDHVDGRGAEHRRKLKNNSGFYNDVVKMGFPPQFQVLCANCNHAKRRLNYCPVHGKSPSRRGV